MTQLYTKVKKYLEANSKTISEFNNNIRLQNDTGTDYIHTWNVSGLTEPTAEQLAAQEASANTEESNQAVIKNRKSEYGSNTQQIENIIENGLVAEQTRVQAIKDKYPKT
tara:strand:- start:35 stop:364 length:330 start_codon:yes stop_codon:yes gene_type:complete